MKKLVLFSLLAVAQVAVAKDIAQVTVGEKVSGELTIDNRTVVLPSGEWTAVAREDSSTGNTSATSMRTPARRITMLLVKGNKQKLEAAIRVIGTIEPMTPSSTGWSDEPCKLKAGSYYLKDDLGSGYDFPVCASLMPIVGLLQGENKGFWKDAKDGIEKNKLSIPSTAMYANAVQYKSRGFLRLSIWYSAELKGFPKDSSAQFDQSDWNPAKLTEDRAKYVESLKPWALEMAKAIKSDDPVIKLTLPN